MRIKFTISLMLALIFCSSVALAAKLQVPSHNYPTIQDGIDAASDGDIVIVADGVFTGLGNKDLDFNGKAITVKSKNGPENCIIDCEDAGRGFIFGSSEGPDSVLSGITITNGNAWFGAGIQCQYASPTIQNMIIKGNTAQDGPGGGIYLDSSDAIIIDSIISENSAGSGAGIDCGFSWAKISKCTIRDNVASKGHAGIYGGNRSNLTISSCIISNNLVTGGGDGAGVSLNASAASLINCMIVNNSTNTRGAGIQIVGDYTWINPISSEITNCTVASNNSPIAAGLYIAASNFPVTITNSIIWGNTPEEIEIANSADPLITYSDVKGGWPDLTNINSDPLFFGLGDYHLTAGSPCMNTGTFDGAPDYDLDGVQRPQGAGYDMGAYECTDTGPTLDVTYPDGGETLIKGNDYLIKWSWSDYSGLIRIHVYLNDVFYYPISNGIDVKQGRNGVEFNPPITWDNSDYYKIHISTLDDQGSDESNDYFTITDSSTGCFNQLDASGLPELQWPLEGLQSDYQWYQWDYEWKWGSCGGEYLRHIALDITAKSGATVGKIIRAAYGGTVKAIYNAGNGWGTGLTIEHVDNNGNKFTTNYTHIKPKKGVQKNSQVPKGDPIGTVADITRSGPHLHFSIRRAPYNNYSNRGALPVVNENGDCTCTYNSSGKKTSPLFPEYFIDPSTASYTSN